VVTNLEVLLIAQQKQENQIKAVRSLYRPGCGWHLLAPGGRNRLGSSIKEAKRASNPVVLIDEGCSQGIPVFVI